MDPRILLRLSRLARHRHRPGALVALLVALALVAGFWAVEAIWGWPDALTPTRTRF